MPATPFDSAIWRSIFHDRDMALLFTDTAVLRAELLVMGTLALTQSKAGLVPEISAKAIQRAALEVQVDPAALGPMTHETGDPVLALAAAFRQEMKAPEHAKWVHLESDPALTAATGRALRMKQVLTHLENRLSPNGQPFDALMTLKPLVLRAYHSDPKIRAGLASGLGLGDGGADATPAHALVYFAQWALDTAETVVADTPAQQAIARLIPHLCQPLFAATDDAATRMIAAMTVAQICLGLATLIPASATLAN